MQTRLNTELRMKIQDVFAALCLLSLFHSSVSATKNSYVVYLGSHAHGSEASKVEFDLATDAHYDLLGSHLGSIEKAKDAIFYSYNKHINGFAAILEEEEAEAISRDSRVVSLFLSKGRNLHTSHSWEFLGIEKKNGEVPVHSLWNKARFGEDVILANLDTGVWPESQSFDDEGLGPVPSRWKGGCQNNTKEGVPCNNKLVGAKFFNKGYLKYLAQHNLQNLTGNPNLYTTRDMAGHGSHTLSTMGGNFVSNVSMVGFANGTVKGGSPKARVAAYRVCYPRVDDGECFDADILAAFDQAIHDGVDVLSLSLGGPSTDYFQDAISIGSFHAIQKGIPVVCSAGNDGAPRKVSNVSPWIITVGASTIDRDYYSYAVLGNHQKFKGRSLTESNLSGKMYYPLISGAESNAAQASKNESLFCAPDSLDREKVKGKIIVCLRGGNIDLLTKGTTAQKAGAVGMILANNEHNGDITLAVDYVLPATHITYTDGLAVFEYINSTKSAVAYITPAETFLNTKPAPYMASFSSQGPNNITSEILKPDITAPGYQILAAYSMSKDASLILTSGRQSSYTLLSGTSMSCPHITGILGLLKSIHPDWSPSAIKSAIMTTAIVLDNVKEPMLNSTLVPATPFYYGAGHVWPNRAADPGLVYDLSPNDYLNFLCGIGYNQTLLSQFSSTPHKCDKASSVLDLNYPSITVPNLSSSVTVTRTVKNVGSPGTYKVLVHEPHGISVSVEPKSLEFKKMGEEKSFKVTIKAKSPHAAEDYVFGALTWADGSHYVRSPIVVKAETLSN